jgi:RNA-directed DNA polymerase
MREPHIEGVATHDDPESCVGTREGAGEALTGARMGTVLSRVIRLCRDADAVIRGGRQHRRHRYREVPSDPARSETRCTCGTSLCENREIPRPPADDGGGSRREVRRT